MNAADLLKLALLLASQAGQVGRSLATLREIYAREHPGDLAAFDAAVAKARGPWAEAADESK